MEVVEVRDRLEALAREVRLISLGLFGIAYLHRNGDDTGPLIDFATQVEDKLLALALEIHPYEEKGLASEGDGMRSRSADEVPNTGETSLPSNAWTPSPSGQATNLQVMDVILDWVDKNVSKPKTTPCPQQG